MINEEKEDPSYVSSESLRLSSGKLNESKLCLAPTDVNQCPCGLGSASAMPPKIMRVVYGTVSKSSQTPESNEPGTEHRGYLLRVPPTAGTRNLVFDGFSDLGYKMKTQIAILLRVVSEVGIEGK